MFDQIPDALHDAIGIVIADQRKAFEVELRQLASESRATIADLRAEIAHLKTANEMLRIDLARRVDEEVLRVREAMSLVKDGAPGAPGRDGKDGADADQNEVVAIARASMEDIRADYSDRMNALEAENRELMDRIEKRAAAIKDGADGPPGPQGERGEPGHSVSAEEVASLVLARMPAPEKGEKGDPGPQGDRGEPGRGIDYVELTEDGFLSIKWSDDDDSLQGLGMIRGPRGEKGDPGPEPDYDLLLERLKEMASEPISVKLLEIDTRLTEAIAAIPPPEKGDPGPPGEKGDPGDPGPETDYDTIARMIDDSIKEMPKPKDGVGLAGALIDRSGALIITLTDGTVRELGQIVGRDGEPGAPGRDGKDGLSFDAFSFEPEYDGERTLRLRWSDARGNEQMREWRLPLMLYREIYKSDARYETGDTVRYGGSLWLATADTSEKPGDGCKDWRLVVRAGRDGRDGAPGTKGEKGDRGPPGPERLVTGGA